MNDTITLSELPILILAGGLGTRLRSAVPDLPKGLAQISDKPFLEIQIDLLKRQGARNFILCLGYMNEKVQNHFGDGSEFGVNIRYSIEREQLLGTAGAVRNASGLYENTTMVLNGDTYFDIDYNNFLTQHQLQKSSIRSQGMIALSKAMNESQYGNVEFDPDSLQLNGFSEKTETIRGMGWVNAGAYLLEKELIETFIPADTPCSIETGFFPAVIRANQYLSVYLSRNAFYDIGTPGSLRAFINFYAESSNGNE